MGHNKWSTIVVDMAKRTGMDGKFTNHSIRATAASCLYQSNVDDQLVIECTSRCSNCVREYKRTSNAHLQGVSEVFYGNSDGISALPVKWKLESEVDSSVKKVEVLDTSKCEINANANPSVAVSGGGDKQVSVNVTVNINK